MSTPVSPGLASATCDDPPRGVSALDARRATRYARAMVRALALGLVLAACSSSEPPNTQWKDTPYGRDIVHLCNAEKESGALEQPEGARQLPIARGRGGGVLETERAHDFLVTLVPMDAAAKAAALRAEARAVGLDDCQIAAAWKPAPK